MLSPRDVNNSAIGLQAMWNPVNRVSIVEINNSIVDYISCFLQTVIHSDDRAMVVPKEDRPAALKERGDADGRVAPEKGTASWKT